MEGEKDTQSLFVFHLRRCASILQFPVWVLSGATWNCAPAESLTPPPVCSPAAAAAAPSLPPSLSFSFSVSILALALPACLCNVMISMLRARRASPGHQSLRRSVSCLTVSQSADQSLRLTLLLNYSFNCSADRPSHLLTHSSYYLFIYFVIIIYFLLVYFLLLPC